MRDPFTDFTSGVTTAEVAIDELDGSILTLETAGPQNSPTQAPLAYFSLSLGDIMQGSKVVSSSQQERGAEIVLLSAVSMFVAEVTDVSGLGLGLGGRVGGLGLAPQNKCTIALK